MGPKYTVVADHDSSCCWGPHLHLQARKSDLAFRIEEHCGMRLTFVQQHPDDLEMTILDRFDERCHASMI